MVIKIDSEIRTEKIFTVATKVCFKIKKIRILVKGIEGRKVTQ